MSDLPKFTDGPLFIILMIILLFGAGAFLLICFEWFIDTFVGKDLEELDGIDKEETPKN